MNRFNAAVAPLVCLASMCASSAWCGGLPVVELDPITVQGARTLENEPHAATEGYVTSAQLAERPISRPGELLEFVPGLIVTQHSGEGKANQWFLRGFNLDHGTDFYTEVDGTPVNMRSHGHGQGYADINFMIPELIGSLEYRKGTYFADVGDFAAAGSAKLRYMDEVPRPLAKVSVGEDGYQTGLFAASPGFRNGKLLLAGEISRYDGAYDLEQDVKKFKGLVRYNRGSETDGFTLGLAAYDIEYKAPDQIPMRAVRQGLIDELGFIDPTDGGEVYRYSANLDWRAPAAGGNWRANAYALKYRMDLYSNFTYFLADPVNGDQFEQFDERMVYGLNARRYWLLSTTRPIDIETGVQLRHDDIDPVGLYLTSARNRLSTVREDAVRESSLGVYLSSTQKWNRWLRTTAGLRGDFYYFDVESNFAPNSGDADDELFSPKLAVVLGPWKRTELYLNYGEGFHSNDARGVTNRVDPTDGVSPLEPVTPLVKARGTEIGLNSKLASELIVSVSLFEIRLDSELVYIGDAGNNEAGPASDRRGIEVSAYWTPAPWLVFDADYAYARARLDVSGPEDRIPNSIENVYSLGLTVPETRGWSAGLRLRQLGDGPLVEDDSARSKSTTVVNAQAGYRWLQRYSVTVMVLNLFDSDDNDITYFYESCLRSEACGEGQANEGGVSDFHFHPVEPRAVRVTVGAEF